MEQSTELQVVQQFTLGNEAPTDGSNGVFRELIAGWQIYGTTSLIASEAKSRMI
jgi:hypothetical protein